MTVQVGAAIDDSIIRNDVTLDSENALAVSAFHETSVRQAAVLKLLKTASFAFVAPGQEITFTLPYENTGNVAATNVIIEDYLPRHMTFVTASGGGVYDTGTGCWCFRPGTTDPAGRCSYRKRHRDYQLGNHQQ